MKPGTSILKNKPQKKGDNQTDHQEPKVKQTDTLQKPVLEEQVEAFADLLLDHFLNQSYANKEAEQGEPRSNAPAKRA